MWRRRARVAQAGCGIVAGSAAIPVENSTYSILTAGRPKGPPVNAADGAPQGAASKLSAYGFQTPAWFRRYRSAVAAQRNASGRTNAPIDQY
jgi:hypothetical protein